MRKQLVKKHNFSDQGQRPKLPTGRVSKAFVAFLFACVLAPAAVFADKAGDDFNLGVGLYRTQRYELAVDTFNQFLKDFPEHPRANLARMYFALSLDSLEKYAPAREQFAAFLKAEPEGRNAAEARYRLGECSYYLRDYPAAIEQLSAYLEKHPSHTRGDWAKLFLGESYVASEQWAKAEETLSPLVKSETTNPAVLLDAGFSMGIALEGLKKVPEALQQYNTIVAAKNPAVSPRALIRIGAIQFTAEQYKAAAATYDELLTTYPTSPQVASANLGAGKAWYRAKEFETALQRFRAVPKDSSSAAQAILMAAMSLRDLGRTEESRLEFAEALKAAGDSPLAADILFQQAQMERTGTERELAASMFEDIADRWPKSGRTAECLFNAAELRLELNDADRAERLFSRLDKEFPESTKQPREQILLGRLFLARGDLSKATDTLLRATETMKDPADRVAAVGRYYLVRALFDSDKHDQVVQQASLMTEVLKSDDLAEMRGALALAAISSLELKQHENVLKFADEFLPLAEDAQKKADIIGTRAVALSHLNRFPEAIESLKSLATTNADQPQTWTAVLQAAETALALKSPENAEALFRMAAAGPVSSKSREAGLSGIAWSQFKSQKYPEAEKSFAAMVTEFPDSKEAAQAIFMQARCVEEQGDPEKIATAFGIVFDRLTKDVAAVPAGAETMPPMLYAFDAGKQTARALMKLKRFADADAAWKKLTTLFPDAKEMDSLLDEWAWMHFSAQNFAGADAIHRQLLEKFPDSPFAGQARLSLAESLLDAGQLEPALKEMEAIVADGRYGEMEKERALFHVIEIRATAREWQPTLVAARTFLTDFSTSPLSPQVRQFAGDALLQLGKPDEAIPILNSLREDIISEKVKKEDWVDRVWVVLAEAALAKQDYDRIDSLQAELKQRSPESLFAFQLNDVQGRRWKQQAPPDFLKAREYFQRVTADPQAEGTETSARCQFLLAETYVMQLDHQTAAKEYFKVYLNYTGHDELRAQALFQGASCQVALKNTEIAVRDFKDLIKEFPKSNLVDMANEELKKLEAAGP
ncbi:MAG: tetratricopeptide repeat protein [Fuerstia sp.]|nr:tetratricopeptide repeat protein [Fuerstiella sp.]